MRQARTANPSQPTCAVHTSTPHSGTPAVDLRYRALLGEAAWTTLPPAVRARFSRHIAPGEAVLYSGEVVQTQLSRCGAFLALLARAVGSPLPDTNGARGAAVVSVIEAPSASGQIWTRTYERPGKFPQVVHSMKRFSGVTGLEEYIGYGLGMALQVSAEDGALVFRSKFFFLQIAGRRFRVPSVLSPGQMRIVHRDEGPRFLFELTLVHPRLGLLVQQRAYFRDTRATAQGSRPHELSSAT